MSDPHLKMPRIDRFYFRYLEDRNAAIFLSSVSKHYSLATLERLVACAHRSSRRAALLALTMAGGHSSAATVGEALRDVDRGVRLIAEDGITALWAQAGSWRQREQLYTAIRHNEARDFAAAIEVLDELLLANPCFAEAWYQRGIAAAGFGEHDLAIESLQRAVEHEPYHFRATLRMADSYLKMRELNNSATCLQWTLRIYPRCEIARARLQRIERLLGEQTDR